LWFSCLVVALVLKLLYNFFGYNHKKNYNDSSCQKLDTYFGPRTADNVKCYLRAVRGPLSLSFDMSMVVVVYSDTPSSTIVASQCLHLLEVSFIMH
jgi:hypothetical protein